MLRCKIKRVISILKDRERFQNRLRMAIWPNPTADALFRVECLVQFHPNKTNRQIFNHAKTSIGE